MSEVMTTPSKGSNTHHRHSKSETPARSVSNPTDSYATPARPSQRRQGRNRNNYDQNQRLSHPAASASDPALTQGYLSAGHNDQGNRKKPTRQNDGSVSDNPAMNNKKNRGRRDRQSTPARGGSPPKHNGSLAAATPAKESAYAGPAFHASPAPASLPMPKFFSKSVPANDAPASMQNRLDQESDSSGTSEKSESPPLVGATPVDRAPPRRTEESPLDLFFRADREEKARKASLLGTATPPGKSPAPVNGRNHSRHVSNNTGRSMFSMEMDGSHATTPKPPSPTPNLAQRMSAGRAATAPSDIPRAAQESDSYPQALKDLFSSSKKPSSQSPLANGFTGTPTQNGQDFHTPSPFYRPSPGPRQVSGGPRTPAGQINLEANPYYYGNRNLSPLFQAAKGDSAKRSSSLRQELDSSPSTQNRAELPVPTLEHIPTTPSRPMAGKPDASAISRNFLNAHIQQAGAQDSLSQMSYTNHPGLRSPFTHTASSAAPRDGSPAAAPDTRLMENDLKRILKLQLVDT
ncbi:hypothetical protein SLS56_011377 [Neofusicoccum ribis]|uniref:Proteophosphoglycan 5 n=1 Tax=Neofusicoccum ribis TaxID=45134 RepID=A0ABR3SBU9_9PEZI